MYLINHTLCILQGRGVKVRVLLDINMADIDDSQLTPLTLQGIAVRRHMRRANPAVDSSEADLDHTDDILRESVNATAMMHHKFAVIDGGPHKEEHHGCGVIMTGSFNWTTSAILQNNENVVVTNDPKVVQQFQEQFEDLWSKA